MPPLIVHVVYRFAIGGLENGVVNLINRLPAQSWRHAVVSLTDVDPAFAARISRGNVRCIALNKAPGHAVRLYPRLVALLRELKPAIVHTRNLAALEASASRLDRRRPGSSARRARARRRRPRRLDRALPAGATVVPSVRDALCRALARPRTLSARAHRRAGDADRPDLQRRRHRALRPAPRRARRDRRLPVPGRRLLAGRHRRPHGSRQGPDQPGARLRRCGRRRPRSPRALAAGAGRRRQAESARSRRYSNPPACASWRGSPASAPMWSRCCRVSTASCCRRWPRAYPIRSSRRWRADCRSSRRGWAPTPSWSKRT